MPTLAYGVGTKSNAGGGEHVHEGSGDHVHEGVPTDIQTQLNRKIQIGSAYLGNIDIATGLPSLPDGITVVWDSSANVWATRKYFPEPGPTTTPGHPDYVPVGNVLTWSGSPNNEPLYEWTQPFPHANTSTTNTGTVLMYTATATAGSNNIEYQWVNPYSGSGLQNYLSNTYFPTHVGASLTEIGHLSGATSNIQTQIETFEVWKTSTTNTYLTPWSPLLSNVTSNIQTQLNAITGWQTSANSTLNLIGPWTGVFVSSNLTSPNLNNHFLRMNTSTGLEWIDPAGIPPIANNLVPQRPTVLPTVPTVLANLTGGMAWCSLNTLQNLNLHSNTKVNNTSILDNLVPSTPPSGGSGNVLTYTLLNGSGMVSWEPITPAQPQATPTVTYEGSGSLAIPDISEATPGSVLEIVSISGTRELAISGGPCYFAGRPSDNSNISMTDSIGPTTFTQFTALTASTGGNSSSGVSWSSGSVTLSTAGVYTVHYGLNVNSTNCKIKRCIAQLRNGTTVLANSKWSSEVNGATPLHFYPSHGSWMGTLAANSSLQLWYQIAVVDTTGATRILEYSTSTYGEYGGTYLYGHKIA